MPKSKGIEGYRDLQGIQSHSASTPTKGSKGHLKGRQKRVVVRFGRLVAAPVLQAKEGPISLARVWVPSFSASALSPASTQPQRGPMPRKPQSSGVPRENSWTSAWAAVPSVDPLLWQKAPGGRAPSSKGELRVQAG